MSTNWKPASEAPEGVVVETRVNDGEVTKLKRRKRLWFVPDGTMYVYFTPTHYRPVAEA